LARRHLGRHLHGLIGDGFAGVVASDRFSAYNSLEPERPALGRPDRRLQRRSLYSYLADALTARHAAIPSPH
jgi:hypothetical protein